MYFFTKLSIFVGLSAALLAFQNCAPSFNSSQVGQAVSSARDFPSGSLEGLISSRSKNEVATVNHIWQLRSDNYYAKVEAAFGRTLKISDKFWKSSQTTNYVIDSEFSDLDKFNLEKVLQFSDNFIAGLPPAFITDCSKTYAVCIKPVLEKLFTDYSPEDLKEYVSLFDNLKKEGFSEEEALKGAIKHALIDSKTLFLMETQDSSLNSKSFFEQHLKNYSEKDADSDVNQRNSQVINSFLTQLFETDSVSLINKTDPQFVQNLDKNKSNLQASIDGFMKSVSDQGGSLDELMYADLSSFLTSLDYLKSAQRRGLLHHPAFLAINSNAGSTNPTTRGITVFSKLLCQQTPELPRDVNVTLVVENQDEMTKRQALSLHAGSPACAGCHKLLDPPGLALENFDSVGNFRLKENNQSIDASADMSGIPLSSFRSTDYLSFVDQLKDTKEYKLCMTMNFVEFLMGRGIVKGDIDFVLASYKELISNNNRLEAVLNYFVNNKLRN